MIQTTQDKLADGGSGNPGLQPADCTNSAGTHSAAILADVLKTEHRRLWAQAYSIVKNVHDAEDLVQQAYLECLEQPVSVLIDPVVALRQAVRANSLNVVARRKLTIDPSETKELITLPDEGYVTLLSQIKGRLPRKDWNTLQAVLRCDSISTAAVELNLNRRDITRLFHSIRQHFGVSKLGRVRIPRRVPQGTRRSCYRGKHEAFKQISGKVLLPCGVWAWV